LTRSTFVPAMNTAHPGSFDCSSSTQKRTFANDAAAVISAHVERKSV
jgi:hypothetical protein